MNATSSYTKVLEPGRWRLQLQAGRELVKVELQGQRHRWYDLTRVERADFQSRLMKRPNGEVPDAVILRGTPAVYTHDGPWLMIWPAPAHNWTLRVTTKLKEK